MDSTGSIIDTINKSVEEFFFQNEIENSDIWEGGKTALTTMSKFMAVITNKRYSRLERTSKVAAVVPLEVWQGQN